MFGRDVLLSVLAGKFGAARTKRSSPVSQAIVLAWLALSSDDNAVCRCTREQIAAGVQLSIDAVSWTLRQLAELKLVRFAAPAGRKGEPGVYEVIIPRVLSETAA